MLVCWCMCVFVCVLCACWVGVLCPVTCVLYLLLPQRVELFRERVTSDKKELGIIRPGDRSPPSTYITIHRPRLLEDGHEQLATLTTKSLKSTIRVKFVNEQVREG